MYGFMFINAHNVNKLFNTDGLIQVGLVSASCLGAFLINKVIQHNSQRAHKPPLHHRVSKIYFSFIFAIFCIVTGLVNSSINNFPSLLNYSIGIFIFALALGMIVYHGVASALGKNRNYFFLIRIIRIILWVLLILWATGLDELLANRLSEISLTFGKTRLSVWFLFKQIAFILIDIGIIVWLSSVVNAKVKSAKDIDPNVKQLLTRLSKLIIIAIGIYIILPSLGVDLTALSILGGALGVGLGFGLQKIASNFLSGFIILVDKSVKIGDRVIINDITGVITKITTRYTVMQAFDGSEIIIPNERFITDTIINQTHTNTDISLDLLISVGYSSDLNQVIELIRKCIKAIDNIRQDKEPSIYIKELNASGIDIFIRVWPRDPINEGTLVRNRLNISLIKTFQDHGVEMPYPRMDITLLNSEQKPKVHN